MGYMVVRFVEDFLDFSMRIAEILGILKGLFWLEPQRLGYSRTRGGVHAPGSSTSVLPIHDLPCLYVRSFIHLHM